MEILPKKHADLVFNRALAEAKGFGLEIVETDFSRPWGGFLRFSENSLPAFIGAYWQGVDTGKSQGRRDPKVLLVAPAQRLSLQLHHRRSELWRVLDGPVLVVHGKDREHLTQEVLYTGDVVRLACGELHRLVGALDSWGRVAEIWEHIDASRLSDESDIERIEDDYAR